MLNQLMPSPVPVRADNSLKDPVCGMALVPMLGSNAGNAESENVELHALKRRLWTGIALTLPLVVLAMSPMVGIGHPFGLLPPTTGWLQMLLLTPTVLWVGAPVLRKFWLSLAHRALNTYPLNGLGVGLAYVFINVIAVLIIACPSAVGLAPSISMTVAMGQGARAGMLFRNAEAIERMRNVDTLVVDKTGTLTLEHPTLTDFAAEGMAENEALELVAGVEKLSEHPIGLAIVEAAAARGLTPRAVDAFGASNGLGVEADIDGKRVLVGSADFLYQRGVSTKRWTERADAWRIEAKTVVYFSVGSTVTSVAAVADPIKDTAVEAITALQKEGLHIVMLTGDSRATAAAVARKIGIEDVLAEVLPADKAGHVKRLQSEGRKVAMAGDGINDAPALAQADVGIAMGTGTDVAMESAGVTRVKGDLRGLVRARMLSRATMRNIRQNLAFALGYNALGIPLAAGVLYPFFGLLLSPMFTGAAMALSSVSVVTNALRLNRVKL